MKKFKPFQIIVLALLAVTAVTAMIVFSVYKGNGSGGPMANISFWGVLSQQEMSPIISDINQRNKKLFNIKYAQKDSSTYQGELIKALASGKGPDFFIVDQEILIKNKDIILPIPFASFSERDFKDAFADAGELFLSRDGVSAVPFLIDPLVLYWNKDLFSSAGLSKSPRDWEEFLEDVKILTQINDAGNIAQSGAAMGEFRNIDNAKGILSMLFLQSGNKIIDTYMKMAALQQRGADGSKPTENAVKFFSEFSNPNKTSYSWNKAQTRDSLMFARGDLAMYFGYASDMARIKSLNPHLNFDIAEAPQIKGSKSRITYGKVYGLALIKSSPSKQAAAASIFKLSEKDSSSAFSQATGLASARRDMLGQKAADSYFSLINKSAIISRSWLEPDPQAVYDIFKDMVESILVGNITVPDAVSLANKKLDQSLKKETESIFNDQF